MAELNWLDYIVVAIFFLSIILGFVRGLVSEIISVLALVAAFVVAVTMADSLAVSIMDYSSVQNLTQKTSAAFGGNTTEAMSYVAVAVSFLLLFAGTIIAGSILKFFLNLAFHTGLLGIGNRLLGAVFGFGRGFILSLVFFFIIQLTPLSNQPWWQQSYFVPIFTPALTWLNSEVAPAIAQLEDKLANSNINAKLQQIIQLPATNFH